MRWKQVPIELCIMLYKYLKIVFKKLFPTIVTVESTEPTTSTPFFSFFFILFSILLVSFPSIISSFSFLEKTLLFFIVNVCWVVDKSCHDYPHYLSCSCERERDWAHRPLSSLYRPLASFSSASNPAQHSKHKQRIKKKKENYLKRKMRLKRQGEQTNVCSCAVGFSFSFLFVHPTDLTDQIGSSADPVSVPPYKLYSINFLLVLFGSLHSLTWP